MTNKTSGGDGIPVELFQILKRWCCESAALNMPANLENSAVATGLEKVSFHSNPKESNAKECSNYCTIALISHVNKVMLKILQAVFSNTWTMNLQMFKLDLEKVEEPEIKLPTSVGSSEKEESSRKNLHLLYWLCQSLWLCESQQTGKVWKRWKYQTTWPASWKICVPIKKQQLELDMEQ